MANILQDIIQSEEEALRIENEARQEALVIVSEARKKADSVIEEALSQGEEITKAILEEAKAEALREQEQNINAQRESGEKLRMRSKEKLEEAVGFILGKVVNKSWQ